MPITIDEKDFPDFASAVRSIMKSKGLCKDKASALVASIARKQGDIEAIEYILKIKKAVEQDFTGTPNIQGTHVFGRLAHAGWSRNGRVYSPGVLAAVPPTLPILLNHATIDGTDGIPEELLPERFKARLRNGEDIQLGTASMRFDESNLELIYDGEVTDPHFSRKDVLRHMNVSLGLLFEGEKFCDQLECYDVVTEPLWREMSLVFSPGFASATLSTESNTSLSSKTCQKNQMSENDNIENTTKATEQIPPADQPDTPDASSGGCPEGSTRDSETGQCVEVPKENSMSDPQAPDVIDEVTEQIMKDDDDDEDKKKGDEVFTPKWKIDQLYPGTESSAFKDNADLKSERERTIKYLKAIERAAAYTKVGQMQKGNELLEAELKRMDLTHKLKEAKEKVNRKAIVPKAQPARATEQDMAKEFVLPKHAYEWFNANAQGKDVSSSKRYTFNKQYIYENYAGRYFKTQRQNPLTGGWEQELTQMDSKQKKATEVLSGPPAADFLQTMSEQVIVDPNGEFTTPIRQFTDMKVLAPGQKEGLFYDLGKVKFAAVDEGGTGVAEQAVTIRSAGGATSPRGALVNIKYSEVEEIPFDVVAKLNEGYALESLIDETKDAVNTKYNDDTANVGGQRKQAGGGAKDNWVNGNSAADIAADATALGKLTFAGLLHAKSNINSSGFRTPNKVTYVSEKGVEDLVTDAGIDSFIQFSRPAIIEEGTAERVAGTNLVSTSELPINGGNTRAVMFVPGVTFGLVTGRDLTMEAQRRNEEQVIKLTGTQKIAAYVKMQESSCRISYTI